MKVYNKSGNGLSHELNGKVYFLANDAIGDMPDTIAKVWLKISGVTKYIAPVDLEQLKAENETLKKAIKRTANKTVKKNN